MSKLTYYTVLIGRRSCLVTYATSPAYEVKLFSGSFLGLDEASKQFKKAWPGKLEYLTQGTFNRKVSLLAQRYQQDLLKLVAWNRGKAIPAPKEGKSTVAVTLEQYFSHLTASGLDLAEDYLDQDLKMLQENDLPVADTVAGLLMVQACQEEEQEEDE
jgi:hypothetical protein